MPTPRARAIAREVVAERDRQDAKWGEQNHPDLVSGFAPLADTAGARHEDRTLFSTLADNYRLLNAGPDVDWTGILLEEVYEALAEVDPDRLRAELIQVAAVAAQWVEAIDRRRSVAPRAKNRYFTHAHLRLVFLLSQTAGGTPTRLERLWAAKVARTGELAWPFISSSGLRTRLSELAQWGVVEWSGDYGMTVSNRRSKVWRLAAIADGSATRIPGYDDDARPALAALRAEAGSDLYTIAALESVASAAGIRG